MASGGLGALTVDLLLETAQWIGGLNKAEQQAQKFADAVGDRLDKMADSALGAMKKMAAGAVAAFAVDHIVGFVNETQKAADALDEMAQKTGASLQYLAQLSVTAGMSGTSIESVASALGKFNKATAEAFKNSASDPAKAFRELGISVTDSSNKLKSSEVLFAEAARAIAAIEEPSLRAAKAMELFGKSGAELVPMMLALANQSAALTEASKRYGAEMEKLAPMAGALEEQQAILSTNSKTLAAIIGQELIPYTVELMKLWNGAAESGSSLAASATFLLNALKGVVIGFDAILTAGASVVHILSGIADAIQLFKIGEFKAAGQALADGFKAANQSGLDFEARAKALADPTSTLGEKAKDAAKGFEDLATALTRATGGLAQGAVLTVEQWIAAIDKQIEKEKTLAQGQWLLKHAELAEKAAKKATAALEKLRNEMEKHERDMEKMAERFVDQSLDASIEKYRRQLDALRAELAAEDQLKREAQAATDKYEREVTEKRNADILRQYGELYEGIANAGKDAFYTLFDDAKGGWDSMMSSLARSFKKILIDYIYQQLAKPFMLKLAASMGGNMGGMAANQLGAQYGDFSGGFDWSGMVSGAQSLYNNFFGGGAGTAYPDAASELAALGTSADSASTALSGMEAGLYGIAGGIGGYFAARLYGAGERGVQNATTYGAMGATAGAYVGSIVPVLGTAIGAAIGWAIGTIIGISTDPDPDAMRKAKFGNITAASEGVTRWTGESTFGKFGFSEGEWLSDEQMGPAMEGAIKGIVALDNTLAQFMTDEQVENVKAKLAELSKVYELGMEHLDVQGLGALIKDRLSVITGEFHKGLQAFVDKFEGDTEELVTIVASFMQAKTAAELFDVDEILDSMRPRKGMDVYQEQRGTLEDLVPTVDATADSMNGLVVQLLAFQTATVQMVAAIDAAAESMHNMFMSTREKIEMSVMTPEERYNYLQAQTEELYRQLETETDPAEIQKLAAKINANINAAWELLTPEQQQAMAESFTTRLTMLDEAVADKMGALREIVIEDAENVMKDITDRLEKVFGTADAAAAAQQDAATRQQAAASTPHTVVVLVSDDGTVRAAG